MFARFRAVKFRNPGAGAMASGARAPVRDSLRGPKAAPSETGVGRMRESSAVLAAGRAVRAFQQPDLARLSSEALIAHEEAVAFCPPRELAAWAERHGLVFPADDSRAEGRCEVGNYRCQVAVSAPPGGSVCRTLRGSWGPGGAWRRRHGEKGARARPGLVTRAEACPSGSPAAQVERPLMGRGPVSATGSSVPNRAPSPLFSTRCPLQLATSKSNES